jgi:hypothetical protein
MAMPLTADVLQDDIALSIARVLAAANKKAREAGVDLLNCLISVTQRAIDGRTVWRVNYGPKDYVGRRGGDLIVEVNADDETISRVLRGQ